jgi:hypothetical protein
MYPDGMLEDVQSVYEDTFLSSNGVKSRSVTTPNGAGGTTKATASTTNHKVRVIPYARIPTEALTLGMQIASDAEFVIECAVGTDVDPSRDTWIVGGITYQILATDQKASERPLLWTFCKRLNK